MLRRFDDHGVAGGERRRDFARGKHERMIEGEDPHDNAKRFPNRVIERAIACWNGLSFHFQRQAGEVFELSRGNLRIHHHCLHGIPAIGCVDESKFLSMRANPARGLTQPATSFERGRAAPGGSSGFGRADCRIHFLLAADQDVPQRFAGRGIERRQRRGVCGRVPLAVPIQTARCWQSQGDF